MSEQPQTLDEANELIRQQKSRITDLHVALIRLKGAAKRVLQARSDEKRKACENELDGLLRKTDRIQQGVSDGN